MDNFVEKICTICCCKDKAASAFKDIISDIKPSTKQQRTWGRSHEVYKELLLMKFWENSQKNDIFSEFPCKKIKVFHKHLSPFKSYATLGVAACEQSALWLWWIQRGAGSESPFRSMEDGLAENGRKRYKKYILLMLNDNELIKQCGLVCAGIMFGVSLMRHTHISHHSITL